MKNLINKIKQNYKLIVTVLIFGTILGFAIGKTTNKQTSEISVQQPEKESQIWTCSMHPQIRQDEPGSCPICGMDLIPLETTDSEEDNIDPKEIQMTESAMALASVQTTRVKRGMPEKTVQLLGKVKADERNISELTARFGGRIEKLFINYTGQNVVKGQKLGIIYSPELISAQKELLEAIKFKKTNPSFYRSVRTKLKLWELTESQIDAIEEKGEPKIYFDILSPITGTVTKRHVAIGDYVKEGSALFEVINLTKVWVLFDAYETDLPWIKKGDKVEFTLQSVPGKTYSGKVTFIDPFIDAATRVAKVRVELNNPEQILKPEMFANGILLSTTAESSNELLIPKSSILWTGKRAVVYVKMPNRKMASFMYREIVLGPEAGNFYVVKEGLEEGEEIAINGVFRIDAAAQLAGKPSMMNPAGGVVSTGHNHGGMDMGDKTGSDNMKTNSNMKANLEHKSFKVSGNCEMCKARIEKAAMDLDGVNSAEWNTDSKTLHVSFNKDKVALADIHKAVAKVGHDTEKETAPNDVYNNLPECCKYTRK